MNDPENNPGAQSLESSQEVSYSAVCAYEVLDEILSFEDVPEHVAKVELPVGFIGERETNFTDMTHVRYTREDDRFSASFESTAYPTFFHRHVYTVTDEGIMVMYDSIPWEDKDRAILFERNRSRGAWIETLRAKHGGDAFHFHAEQDRLHEDLARYKQLLFNRDALGRAQSENDYDGGDGSDGAWIESRLDRTDALIKLIGTDSDSNLGVVYEKSYQDMLKACEAHIDLQRAFQAKADIFMTTRLQSYPGYYGEPISGHEASSLLRVIEKTKTLPFERDF